MSIRYKLKRSNFSGQNSFHARTVIHERVNLENLVAEMESAGSSLTAIDIRGSLELLKKTALNILARGGAVEIEDFIKIRPRVTTVIKNTPEGEIETEPEVSVLCSVSDDFKASLRKKATIERIEALSVIPLLQKAFSGPEKLPVIHPRFINNLKGSKLKYTKYRLTDLKITNTDRSAETATLPVEELVIDYHTDKLIVFTFRNQDALPPWLVDGIPIAINLIYTNGENQVTTNAVTATWQVNV